MDLKEQDLLGDDAARHWYYVSKGRALRALLAGHTVPELLDLGAGSRQLLLPAALELRRWRTRRIGCLLRPELLALVVALHALKPSPPNDGRRAYALEVYNNP